MLTKTNKEYDLPEFLKIPDKLMPMIEDADKYRNVVLEGGRGSSKSQSVARWILYLAEKYELRVVCGRETQNSIDESVYTVLVDLIREFNLAWEIRRDTLTSMISGSKIRFRGFREQGAINIKGMEGVDIVWVEEAQAISKNTLDILIPTIRKEKAKLFFTMNRFTRNDAVIERFANRDDALIIHIDYFENPYCPQNLILEAEDCKAKNIKDYNHIWLGHPLANAEDYLFNFEKLADSPKIQIVGDLIQKQKVLSIDFAAGGGDLCVATVLERVSNTQFRMSDQIVWDDPDTDSSVGRAIAIYGDINPDIFIVDAGGLGYPMFCSISKSIPSVIGFDGSKTNKASTNAGNNRAEAYLAVRDFINTSWLKVESDYTIKELEKIKKVFNQTGKIYIERKDKMKKRLGVSPDRSDSLAMAVFAAKHYLGKVTYGDEPIGMRTQRVNKRVRY